MTKEVSLERMFNILFEQVKAGIGPLDSAEELAFQYQNSHESIENALAELISTESMKAAGTGFITGLGGYASLPITLPSNLIGVLFIQMRLITTIALIKGISTDDPRLKILVLGCLCGELYKTSISKLLHTKLCVNSSAKFALQLTKHITDSLVNKCLTHSFKHITKFIPLVGGFISGGIDYTNTRIIGNTAKSILCGK
ncbi:EcsC family protein [Thorsellia kenyensis]|uniref:EcsC family protein n=1 Tax=Thorsellia kenyensis TaxID=1549888 RepID=A0ABV6CB70_9GAMM